MIEVVGGDTVGPTPGAIAADLVEYMVLVVPGPEGLGDVAAEVVRVAASEAVRVLDMVVVQVDEGAVPELVEIESIPGFDALRESLACREVLLSQHDVELVALVLDPGDCAIVLVVEDRWAEPLAAAARASGGELRAGERIARERVELALGGIGQSS